MNTVAEALLRMPPNFYLKCGMEVDPETGAPFLSAVIMEVPPEGGWASLADYFRAPGYKEDGRLERFKLEDACRVGISCDDAAAFDGLVIGMISSRWPVTK